MYPAHPFSYPPDNIGWGFGDDDSTDGMSAPPDQADTTPAPDTQMAPPAVGPDGTSPAMPGMPQGPMPTVPGMHHGLHHGMARGRPAPPKLGPGHAHRGARPAPPAPPSAPPAAGYGYGYGFGVAPPSPHAPSPHAPSPYPPHMAAPMMHMPVAPNFPWQHSMGHPMIPMLTPQYPHPMHPMMGPPMFPFHFAYPFGVAFG